MLRALLGLAVGILVVGAAALYLGIEPRRVFSALSEVSPWVIAGCVGSSFVVLGLQSFRWHLVMTPLLGLRYRQAFKVVAMAALFNAVIPARGGDFLRVQYLGRRTGKNRGTILGTEVVDRWLDWSGWFPLLLVMSIAGGVPQWLYGALGVFSGLMVAWAIVMAVLARRGFVPREGSGLGQLFASFQTGVQAFRSKRTLAIALLVAPLPWLWETIVLALLGKAFAMDLSLPRAFSVLIGFNVATVVPSPGSIGTIEAGGTAALASFGIDQSKALAYMFVYHFTQLIPAIAAGAVFTLAEGERLLQKKSRPVTNDPAPQ